MREGGLVFELVHLNCSLFSSQEPCDRETVVYCLEDTLATPTGTNPACYMELTPTLLLCPSIHTSPPPLTHTHIHTSPPPLTHTHTHTHAEEVPDSFFNVTVQDVKNMQDDLKRQV